MLIGVIAALVACFSYGTASVLQSHAARRGGEAAVTAPTFRSTVTAILAPLFLAGMLLDGLGFLGSLVSARLIPLFLSQTIMSANLAVTAVLSVLVLGVRLRPRDWAAIAIVLAALCVLGFSAGELGTEVPGRHMHWSVLAASVLIFVFGVVLVRVLGKKAAVPAGLIAGILYGAMAVAVRIAHGLDPFQWHALVSDPAAWAVLVAGGGGFYDYPAGQPKQLWPGLKAHFERADAVADVAELKQRLLYRQSIETARCLAENVLTSVHEANIGSIFGIGFPAWTGGALQFVASEGLDTFLRNAEVLAARHGERFALVPAVQDALRRALG